VGFLVAWYVWDTRFARWIRIGAVLFGIAWALFIAASRVFLGVHFLSDVLAGLGLGTAIAAGSVAMPHYWQEGKAEVAAKAKEDAKESGAPVPPAAKPAAARKRAARGKPHKAGRP
jgi:hypothetical protein